MSNPFGSGSLVEIIIVVIVFLAVSAGAIFLLSGGQWLQALAGMFRVALTIFTTPFVFLRDALVIIAGARDAEQDYARTRVFTLFRYSRIQYLGIFIGTLIVLSTGITASLMQLYPRAELESHRILSERIRDLREQEDSANEELRAAGSEEQRNALEEARAQADRAYQSQVESNVAFVRNAPFNSVAISQIANARSADAVSRLDANVDSYMLDCPRGFNWGGYTVEDCARLRALLHQLAQRRLQEFTLADALREAERAAGEASNAAQMAEARVTQLREEISRVQDQRGEVSLFNPRVMGSKIGAAIAGLISTLLAVVFTVWLGALIVDFFNWVILMMRAAEKNASEELARG
jgi:ElaB/YqjD/DUF883 family membrane-anchored ribosome-binding protein